MQLELELADHHVVAGLEAPPAQFGEHSDLLEALLEIGERLRVRGVVAGKQQLDAAPVYAEAVIAEGPSAATSTS